MQLFLIESILAVLFSKHHGPTSNSAVAILRRHIEYHCGELLEFVRRKACLLITMVYAKTKCYKTSMEHVI